MFFKIGVLKNFAVCKKTPVMDSLFNKSFRKNAYFEKHLRTAAFEIY